MHLIIATRGIKKAVDEMIMNLQSLYVPNTFPDGSKGIIQCNVQPIQLWSIVFPEEHIDMMLRTLKPDNHLAMGSHNKDHPGYNFRINKHEYTIKLLQKMLGLKPIPKWDPQGMKFPIYRKHMQVVGLGIKHDYKINDGKEIL